MKRLILLAGIFFIPATSFAQLQAPNERATVAAVRAAHPEIDTCDDASLTAGRAAIVDWSAQKLNVRDGAVRWGRKGSNASGAVKNTDALTFKRADGLFEIYDVISGGKPCNASWQAPTRALKPGENGWWAPPQLGPEPTGGTNVPPPPPPPPDSVTQEQLAAAIVELHTTLWSEVNSHMGAVRDHLSAVRDELGAVRDLGLQTASRVSSLELAAGKTPADTAPPPPTSDVAADVKRIRELLELVAKRFGLQ